MNKLNYIFRGHFYNMKNGSNIIMCRQQLIITKKGTEYDSPFDLVVILMNPGSSKPINEEYKIRDYSSFASLIDNNELVITAPDNTQYQIVKVMDKMNYKNTLIINLSDIRESKSSKFYETLKGDLNHSIFHKSRNTELNSLISNKKSNAPLILGWGVSKRLEPLTELYSLSTLEAKFNNVIKKEKKYLKYYHPLPRIYNKQVEWVEEITSLLKSI